VCEVEREKGLTRLFQNECQFGRGDEYEAQKEGTTKVDNRRLQSERSYQGEEESREGKEEKTAGRLTVGKWV
jgi:hypothetical protein